MIEFVMVLDLRTLMYHAAWESARRRAEAFSKAFYDLRGSSPRPDATEGGGILPAAPGGGAE